MSRDERCGTLDLVTLWLSLALDTPRFAMLSQLRVAMILVNSAWKTDTVPVPCSRESSSRSAVALGIGSTKALLSARIKAA